MLYVTEERACLLVAQLQVWNARIAVLKRDQHLVRNDGDWSGMLTPQTCDELVVLERLAADMKVSVSQFQITTLTDKVDRVRIGNVLELYVEGEEKTRFVQVGGFGDEDAKALPYPIATYMAPIVMPFMGRQRDHEAKVLLNEVRRSVYLERIFLPTTAAIKAA